MVCGVHQARKHIVAFHSATIIRQQKTSRIPRRVKTKTLGKPILLWLRCTTIHSQHQKGRGAGTSDENTSMFHFYQKTEV
jgi:hypothetical protein